jgi:hypothetical protein
VGYSVLLTLYLERGCDFIDGEPQCTYFTLTRSIAYPILLLPLPLGFIMIDMNSLVNEFADMQVKSNNLETTHVDLMKVAITESEFPKLPAGQKKKKERKEIILKYWCGVFHIVYSSNTQACKALSALHINIFDVLLGHLEIKHKTKQELLRYTKENNKVFPSKLAKKRGLGCFLCKF